MAGRSLCSLGLQSHTSKAILDSRLMACANLFRMKFSRPSNLERKEMIMKKMFRSVSIALLIALCYQMPAKAAMAQQAYLKASNTEDWDQFGWSVALSGDTVVIGAIGEDSS